LPLLTPTQTTPLYRPSVTKLPTLFGRSPLPPAVDTQRPYELARYLLTTHTLL
jgi:hypothetical protein